MFASRNLIFDGFLPDFKNDTRLARMRESVNRLQKFRTQNSQSYNRVLPFASGWNSVTKTTKLSPPPFIVSVLISHLQSTKWADRIQTVFGEADAYCALKALKLKKGGIILTNDSDLLLFRWKKKDGKIPENYAVMMFRDLVFENLGSVKGAAFYVGKIEEELKTHLVQIAYQLKETPGLQRMSVLQEGAKAVSKKPGWGLFVLEYDLPTVTASKLEHPLMAPRIAEAYHNIRLTQEDGIANVYHPVLWEDSTAFPAYDVGSSIRSLAYSILNLRGRSKDFGGPTVVHEHGRCGANIHSKKLPLLDKFDKDFAKFLQSTLTALENIPELLLKQVLTPYISRSCTLPPKSALLAMLECTQSRSRSTPPSGSTSWNWNQTHWFAAWQSAVYSLYVLKEAARLTFESTDVGGYVEQLRAISKIKVFLKDWEWWKWIDGEVFLAALSKGAAGSSKENKKMVDDVYHWAKTLPDEDDDEQEGGEEAVEDAEEPESPASPRSEWKSPEHSKRKHTKSGSDSSSARDKKIPKSSSNRFAMLLDSDEE